MDKFRICRETRSRSSLLISAVGTEDPLVVMLPSGDAGGATEEEESEEGLLLLGFWPSSWRARRKVGPNSELLLAIFSRGILLGFFITLELWVLWVGSLVA